MLQSAIFLKGRSLGRRFVWPFEMFMGIEASGGILLLIAAVVALVWSNSSLAPYYTALFHTEISLGVAGYTFSKSLHFWINEGLMTIFFFLVGLEIKNELVVGQLSSFRRAILPAFAAVGGMVVPAGIYMLFNHGTPTASGWAIPMATDIAFVVGALTLLGSRAPSFLGIFLVSLAIFDDLGAVIVIAVFFGGTLQLSYLLMAVAAVLILVMFNFLGFQRFLPYLVVGVVMWIFIYKSGVHATIDGVVLALTIPVRSSWNTRRFAEEAGAALQRFSPGADRHYTLRLNQPNAEVVRDLENLLEKVEPPLQRTERRLHPWVAYVVMPLFALANSGVVMSWEAISTALTSPISLGIALGLFIGKQLGIFSVTWLLVKSGFASLPLGTTFRHIYGGAILCGIGFTMSLFLADLSFAAPEYQKIAKISILFTSLLAGVTGFAVLMTAKSPSASFCEWKSDVVE